MRRPFRVRAARPRRLCLRPHVDYAKGGVAFGDQDSHWFVRALHAQGQSSHPVDSLVGQLLASGDYITAFPGSWVPLQRDENIAGRSASAAVACGNPAGRVSIVEPPWSSASSNICARQRNY